MPISSKKLKMLEDDDRGIYFDAMNAMLSEFHNKTAAYLTALTRRPGGRKNASAEVHKAFRDQVQKDHLDPQFLQAFQSRVKRYDPVFSPLRYFMEANESDFATHVRNLDQFISRQGNVNPLVVAAFKAAPRRLPSTT